MKEKKLLEKEEEDSEIQRKKGEIALMASVGVAVAFFALGVLLCCNRRDSVVLVRFLDIGFARSYII